MTRREEHDRGFAESKGERKKCGNVTGKGERKTSPLQQPARRKLKYLIGR
jgi:hypothetical protein